MAYHTPVIDVIGSASGLIQARHGMCCDGGPQAFSMRLIASILEDFPWIADRETHARG